MKFCAVFIILLVPLPIAPKQTLAAPSVQAKFSGLNFPLALKFAPDGRIFFNEKDTGNIRIILQNGSLLPTPFATVTPLYNQGESGLLGIALDPNFASNHYVYVYYTSQDNQFYTHGHIRRYTANGNIGTNPFDIFNITSDSPNTSPYHNGGYIKFGPDGKLYAQAGEYHNDMAAQNLSTNAGKILRMNNDGSISADNPFPNSLVYAYGIRNAFGMDWDKSNGRFIETEAGPTYNDEINVILPRGNYGWPICTGPCQPHNSSLIDPILAFDPVVTPTGIAYVAPNTYYFGEWNTGNLMQLNLTSSGTVITTTQVYHADGGVIAVELGPDGNLYFTTQDTIYVLFLPATLSADLTVVQLYGLIMVAAIAVAAGAFMYWKKSAQRKSPSLQTTVNPAENALAF